MTGLEGVISALGSLAHIAVEVVFLVISLTIVRKHRPEAALLFAGGATLALLTTLAWLAFAIAARFISSGALFGGISTIYTAVQLGSSLMSVLGQILVIAGVVRLVRPERNVAHDPGRYE